MRYADESSVWPALTMATTKTTIFMFANSLACSTSHAFALTRWDRRLRFGRGGSALIHFLEHRRDHKQWITSTETVDK